MTELNQWITDILNSNSSIFEDAYWGDRPDKNQAIPILIELLKTSNDTYTRGKIIELLGESEDIGIIEILQPEGNHPDQSIRDWANASITALRNGDKWQQSVKYL